MALDMHLCVQLSETLTRLIGYAQTTEPGTFDAELEGLANLVEASACELAGESYADFHDHIIDDPDA
jgi:hypothetical protein|tara:strand:+ start:1205 stop:1405 length:201 start_codon:yes stop_codon:yes gene_type:complete